MFLIYNFFFQKTVSIRERTDPSQLIIADHGGVLGLGRREPPPARDRAWKHRIQSKARQPDYFAHPTSDHSDEMASA